MTSDIFLLISGGPRPGLGELLLTRTSWVLGQYLRGPAGFGSSVCSFLGCSILPCEFSVRGPPNSALFPSLSESISWALFPRPVPRPGSHLQAVCVGGGAWVGTAGLTFFVWVSGLTVPCCPSSDVWKTIVSYILSSFPVT